MLGRTKATKHESTTDAVAADFCRIFDKDMDGLYLLSFLLTADQRLAADCFAGGLEDAINSNGVFQQWAHEWARRMIIQNAIQIIQPMKVEEASVSSDHSLSDRAATPARIAVILALPAFERFVFVMSVLERYSEQDCSALLGCSRAEVIATRTRALLQIGESVELQRQLSIAGERTQRENRNSDIQYNPVVQLAPSV
jgi:DNA-directed RNA polymerase specialized sigma24 family protein